MTVSPRLPVWAFALMLGASPAALAQDAPVPPESTPGQTVQPSGDPCAALPDGTTGDGTLTGQLSDCGGVLTPPDESDPDITAPVPDPDPGTTPVIPPEALPETQDPT